MNMLPDSDSKKGTVCTFRENRSFVSRTGWKYHFFLPFSSGNTFHINFKILTLLFRNWSIFTNNFALFNAPRTGVEVNWRKKKIS